MSRRENLKRLLTPRSVVFVGGAQALAGARQCRAIGFSGDIWLVNPKRAGSDEFDCFHSVDELPGVPDAAWVAVRREVTVEVVRALSARGAGGCVCFAAGFAEVGGEGVALQAELVEAAGEMALIGPNCYGAINYLDRVALWPDVHTQRSVDRGIALISQSGNLTLTVVTEPKSLPLAYAIGIGNQAMLGIPELIDAVLDDPRVAAIGLYVEAINDVRRFSEAALRALEQQVPIVALKAGRSAAGASFTMSHTSSMAGSDDFYQALFERSGVIRATSLAAALETLKVFVGVGELAGNGFASVSCSGAEAALIADFASDHGLYFPAFTSEQVAQIEARVAHFTNIVNPFDYNTSIWGDAEALIGCFTAVMSGEQDVTVFTMDYPGEPDELFDRAIGAVIEARRQTGHNAVVCSVLHGRLPAAVRERLWTNGIVALDGFDEGMTALAAAARYGAHRARVLDSYRDSVLIVPRLPEDAKGERSLDEWQAKRALAEFGLRVPEGHLVNGHDVGRVAAELGFPVVLKAVDPRLTHKTEAGAVVLNLQSEEAVRAAADQMRSLSEVSVENFLVERMVQDTVAELIIGIKREEGFGHALVLGSGGVLVNLIDERRILLLPTDPTAISEALESLKTYALLAGYRGASPGDRAAVIEAVLAVAAFAEKNADKLLELDVNPLLVLPEGEGAVAADVYVRLGV